MRKTAAIALLAVSCVLMSCQVRGAQMSQNKLLRFLERKSGLICYVSPDGNIRVIDQGGGGGRALTDDAGPGSGGSVLYMTPTWSPDGKLVAYTRFTLGSANKVGGVSLFAAEARGAGRIRLLSTPLLRPFYLYWSPDSKKLSLLSQVAGENDLELGVSSAGSQDGYQRIDRGAPYYWNWLSDSSSIAAHVNGRQGGIEGERLSLISIGAAPERKDLPVRADLFQAPDLSPDGKLLAYVTGTDGGFSLRLRKLDDSSDREIASDEGAAYFAFSRDGRRIAYLSAPRTVPLPQGTLTIVSLSGRGAPVKPTEAPVLAFFWAPNGKRLAFIVPDPDGPMDPMFQAGEGQLPLRMVGCDPASGRTWTIARFPGSRGLLSILPFFDQYQRSATLWSPDSRLLVFTAISANGEPGLYVARADGNVKPRFLTAGDFGFWSWK